MEDLNQKIDLNLTRLVDKVDNHQATLNQHSETLENHERHLESIDNTLLNHENLLDMRDVLKKA